MRSLNHRWALACTASALLFCIAGCQIGPDALRHSNVHYGEALRIAGDEQLLLNIVRLRYRDQPIFLNVSNISTQFELESSTGVSGTLIENVGNSGQLNPNSVGADARLRYSERPTITFSLMQGEEFQKRILTSIEVSAVVRLAESGWRFNRLLQLTVEQINGLKNAPGASGPTPTTAPPFRPFMEAVNTLVKLAKTDLIDAEFEYRDETLGATLPIERVDGDAMLDAAKAGARFRLTPDGTGLTLVQEKRVLVLRLLPASNRVEEVRRWRRSLQLDDNARRISVVDPDDATYDPFDEDPKLKELILTTRSFLGTLYYVSHAVQVPAEHRAAGLVTNTRTADGKPFDWTELLDNLFVVHHGKRRPENAAVAVRYRGHWFYISDNDTNTKSTFTLLGNLFALQSGEVEEVKPVLTLPVGS